MRNQIQSLSLTKACTGILFFLMIDCISLVLFESSVLATTIIAYGAYVTASARILPTLLAFIAVLLMTFVKGGNCLVIASYAVVYWSIITLLRKYLWYSWPVRFVFVSLLLFISEPGRWYIAKGILNLLWIGAGVAFFA